MMHAAIRRVGRVAIFAGSALLTGLAVTAIGLWLVWPTL